MWSFHRLPSQGGRGRGVGAPRLDRLVSRRGHDSRRLQDSKSAGGMQAKSWPVHRQRASVSGHRAASVSSWRWPSRSSVGMRFSSRPHRGASCSPGGGSAKEYGTRRNPSAASGACRSERNWASAARSIGKSRSSPHPPSQVAAHQAPGEDQQHGSADHQSRPQR